MSQSAHELRKTLAPVCGRLKRRAALKAAVQGLTLGAGAAFVAALLRVAPATGDWPAIVAVTAIVAFPLLAIALAMLVKSHWKAAARAVDNHFGLQDRTLTALGLAAQTDPSPMAELQLRDALKHLENIKAREVRVPPLRKAWWSCLLLAAAALAVALLPVEQLADSWLSVQRQDTPRSLPPVEDDSDSQRQIEITSDLAEVSVLQRRASSTGNDNASLQPAPLQRRSIVDRYFGERP